MLAFGVLHYRGFSVAMSRIKDSLGGFRVETSKERHCIRLDFKAMKKVYLSNESLPSLLCLLQCFHSRHDLFITRNPRGTQKHNVTLHHYAIKPPVERSRGIVSLQCPTITDT